MTDKRRNIMAVICQSGASNERRVAMSLIEAIDEVRAEGGDAKTDPACYLILHQLVHLMTGYDLEAVQPPVSYFDAYNAMGDLWDRNDRGELRLPPLQVDTRCGLCKYQHGHAIGCANNPVDIALRNSPAPAPSLVWKSTAVGKSESLPPAVTDAGSAYKLTQSVLYPGAPAWIRHDEGDQS